ncbi:dynamin family protein [Clostridium formicaceticum]|uniref:Bacterial dynamin-like protein n=1 Tax=Clostridium formicaceticum TaxID=1497 RepID=A0AAC9RJ35_9CLOT|nr:dynamin family protein [Clostridium formicaceticum]AOY75728.1 hypothetical protein BJL90_07350 [Clostridium formicaceticum]ARE86048.1 Bacterial dynamin-like protein [Clostridium formicaceticum]
MKNVIDESIMDRIFIDFEEVKNDIQSILDELLQFKIDKRIQVSVGSENIEKLHAWERNIKRRLNDDFSIVIIGDFKRGKSTLVNALLREQVVTTNVTPETVTINRISFGEKNSIEAVLQDGRRAMLDMVELNREKLEKIISKLPSPVAYIDIKVPVDALKGIRIVDTPGVGDLLRKFDHQVQDYMVHADAVIYVVSALSPLSETEQAFLCASILPQNFSKLFVVLNMVDCLESKEEVEKVKGLTNSKLANIFPNSYVYAVSCLDEFCRRKNLKRPKPDLKEVLERSFDAMYDTLQNDIVLKKDSIQTERCLNMLKIMISEIEGRIALIENMLLLNQSKLKILMDQYQNENSDLLQRINKHKESLKLEVREMHSEAREWMEDFLSRLEEEIRSAESTPLETLEKHFHFYMIDMLRSAMIECTNAHLKNIAELLKSTTTAFAYEFSNLTSVACSTKIATSTVEVSWTNLDATAAALNFIPGLGPLTLLGQAIIGFSKQKNTSNLQKKYTNNILNHYREIKESVFLELRSIYENLVQFAEQQINIIYQNQVEASVQAIKQAQEIAMKESTEKEEMHLGLDAAKQILASAKLRLSKYEEVS